MLPKLNTGHVMNRGRRGERIFESKDDYERFPGMMLEVGKLNWAWRWPKMTLDDISNYVYTSDIQKEVGMIAKIQKWGNSQGLRLAKSLLADAQIGVGDAVDVSVRDGMMIIKPVKKIRGRHSLKELVDRIPKDHQNKEVDWGDPVGREAW